MAGILDWLAGLGNMLGAATYTRPQDIQAVRGLLPPSVNSAMQTAFASPAANDALGLLGGLGMAAAGKPGIFPAYHGTGQAFDAFSSTAPKTTGGGLNDKGFFFTPDPKVASRYADFGGPSPNVRMHNVQMNAPLEMNAGEFERMQDVANLLRSGKPIPEVKGIFLQDDLANAGINWDGASHPIDAIRAAGYDGIIKKAARAGAEPEYMVFDPKQILPPWTSK